MFCDNRWLSQVINTNDFTKYETCNIMVLEKNRGGTNDVYNENR